MTRTRGYKRYSAEFKREALRRASEDGMTEKQACQEREIKSVTKRHGEFTSLGE